MPDEANSETNLALVRRYLDEAWNRGNLAVIDELMAPNYVRILPLPAPPLDREGQKRRIAGFRTAFPDLHLDVEQLLAQGDLVAFRILIRGTHTGPFQGLAPTGRSITLTATDILRIAGGQVVEHWGNLDELGLLRQLGILPTP
ncbi:MAG TPA: ester cyclase [Ktedonobacterales bacterium]|jgi:predicted SnoaL-like aldol condensation-catalyzing enzyme|nr:ester cyclase [Ktedonobacterales bacterium]